MELDERISQANARLKEARVGVSISQKGNRLYVRAIFPPRPNSEKTRPYQQRLFLGLPANPAGVKEAEKEARKIGALLVCKEFDWEPYINLEKQPESCGEWVDRFEADYFSRRKRSAQSETTYAGYNKIFRKLPLDKPMTTEVLKGVILATEPDSRTRQRACQVLGALARLAQMELDTKTLAGSYKAREKTPLEIPQDLLIAEYFHRIQNPGWKWIYGVIATYGLRPHEAFRLNFEAIQEEQQVLQVMEETKTGARRVWPCYPEWVEMFNLKEVQLPQVNLHQSNEKLGRLSAQYFNRNANLPFVPYALRHAWAVRTIRFGLDVRLAAQQMGHSVEVHTQTYNRWINDRHHQEAFELVMLRSDRPKPPVLEQIPSEGTL